jgi:hypothetical protein
MGTIDSQEDVKNDDHAKKDHKKDERSWMKDDKNEYYM